MNSQQPEKVVKGSSGDSLDVHSIFYTVQGEGPFTGTPCVFIRLAGCNLQCPACDTDYTKNRRVLSIPQIVNKVIESCSKRKDTALPYPAPRSLVVITGGEPFRQNIAPLLKELVAQDFYVQIETNGTLPAVCLGPEVTYNKNINFRYGVYIVVSPKSGKVHSSIASAACAYKYVLAADEIDPSDGLPIRALMHPAAPRTARPPSNFPRHRIYVQPMDWAMAASADNIARMNPIVETLNQASMKATLLVALQFGYTIQLQTHKYLGVE